MGQLYICNEIKYNNLYKYTLTPRTTIHNILADVLQLRVCISVLITIDYPSFLIIIYSVHLFIIILYVYIFTLFYYFILI